MRRRTVLALLLAALLPACGLFRKDTPRPPAPPGASPAPAPPAVAIAPEPVLVRAWAEPRQLPPAGGQAQILVLVRRRNGDPFEGVQVQLQASAGSLFSGGRILTTDASGRTRDRLTTRRPSIVRVNAGGTVQEVAVAVGGDRP